MQRIVLDEFAPPSVVVNGEGQIICSSSGLEKYLTIGAGNFQNNVVKLARSGLRVGIRTALNEALESRRTVTREDIALKTEKGVERIRLTVQPMPQLGEGSGLFLLVFADLGLQSDSTENRARPTDDEADAFIEHLEAELLATREHLERTIQETETANEELKSSNEELLSMNEELQSANEELETSRDEIQSANDALARINSDLENLLASTRIATIFLDDSLKIHRYTPAVTAIYNLIPGDVGRPLSDITHRAVQMPPLPRNAALLDRPAEDEIQTLEGRWYIRRVLPYRTTVGRPQGLVVTFLDVTDLKEAEASLRDRETGWPGSRGRRNGCLGMGSAHQCDGMEPSHVRSSGTRSRSDLTRRHLLRRVHPDDLARCRRRCAAVDVGSTTGGVPGGQPDGASAGWPESVKLIATPRDARCACTA